MATETKIQLVDDIDGTKAVRTREFAVDGKAYVIDLSPANSEKLDAALAEYIGAARRAGGSRRAAPVKSARQSDSDREESQRIREWARGRGFKVADRGRIPDDILEAYANLGKNGTAQPTGGEGGGGAIAQDDHAATLPGMDTPATNGKPRGKRKKSGPQMVEGTYTDAEVIAWMKGKGMQIPPGAAKGGTFRGIGFKRKAMVNDRGPKMVEAV